MKLPPYGKYLYIALSEGNNPTNDVYLFVGKHAWGKARNSFVMRPTRTLCLPYDHFPEHYDWPVKGCDILVLDTGNGAHRLIDLSLCLYQDGAKIVRSISPYNLLTIYKKEF